MKDPGPKHQVVWKSSARNKLDQKGPTKEEETAEASYIQGPGRIRVNPRSSTKYNSEAEAEEARKWNGKKRTSLIKHLDKLKRTDREAER